MVVLTSKPQGEEANRSAVPYLLLHSRPLNFIGLYAKEVSLALLLQPGTSCIPFLSTVIPEQRYPVSDPQGSQGEPPSPHFDHFTEHADRLNMFHCAPEKASRGPLNYELRACICMLGIIII